MTKKPKRILVIDDDPNIVRLLDKWLNNAGCEVLGAYNGKAGLELARKDQPDLILLDLMLPDIGGLKVAQRLRAKAKTENIPVIFMTVTMGVEIDKGNETMEVDGWLYRVFAKPLHRPKILSEIRKSINRRVHGNKLIIRGS